MSRLPYPPGQEPLQALAACNERLLHHCATLARLASQLGDGAFDPQARSAVEQLSRFFDQALPLHHADQEQDLFPALLEAMAGSDAVCLQEIGDGLAQEHRELQRLWLRLRPALQDLASGRVGSLPAQELEGFIARCQACVAREDGELLPMAARLLLDGQLEQLAEAMRRRRSTPT